jgi:glycosyltransferase involved in cell wall biosynthesis
MRPFITYVTPTLQRPSLLDTCRSLDNQTFTSWSHIVLVDCEERDEELLEKIKHPQRGVLQCGRPHRNGGNSCRAAGVKFATGEWVAWADDDNTLYDEHTVERLHMWLSPLGEDVKWALFPIMRLGHRFYTDPPRSCHVDSANFLMRREIAYWPETQAYGTDGVVVDDLMARKVPYVAFPDAEPIGIIPKISFCK